MPDGTENQAAAMTSLRQLQAGLKPSGLPLINAIRVTLGLRTKDLDKQIPVADVERAKKELLG